MAYMFALNSVGTINKCYFSHINHDQSDHNLHTDLGLFNRRLNFVCNLVAMNTNSSIVDADNKKNYKWKVMGL